MINTLFWFYITIQSIGMLYVIIKLTITAYERYLKRGPDSYFIQQEIEEIREKLFEIQGELYDIKNNTTKS